ncbi:hypothetical protein ACFY36_04755 [Actinoplanes sp. NPDC000266]
MTLHIVEAGRLDSVSLFARFNFRQEDLLTAAATGRKPEPLRTYLHELTHYLQAVTTPYGYFLQCCRILQKRATVVAVRTLLEGGCPVRLPLLTNLPAMPAEVEAEVGRAFSLWLNVEHLIAVLSGDDERATRLTEWFVGDIERVKGGRLPLRPPLLGLRETFALVQDSLADLMNFDAEALATEMKSRGSDFDRRMEKLVTGLSVFGGNHQWSVAAILESAATAAELWGSGLDFATFEAWAGAAVPAELRHYREPLASAMETIRTRDVDSFLLSYMAICDAALCAPLLPQHARLRLAKPGFDQLMPSVRFGRLLSAATGVTPMRDHRDAQRYVGELFASLDWCTPAEVGAEAVHGTTDPLSFIYEQSRQWRAEMSPAAFIGVDGLLIGAGQWRDLFNFVIIDYSDKTTYHRDKDFLESMTTRYLEMLGLQAVMLGDTLELAVPYNGRSEAECQWMTDWLRQHFAALFDRDFPELRFVP